MLKTYIIIYLYSIVVPSINKGTYNLCSFGEQS